MSKKKRKYRVRYKQHPIYFDHPIRKDSCEACGRSVKDGDIKSTQKHHWVYSYTVKQVQYNPELALYNTVDLDYYCHQIGDALRVLCTPKSLNRVLNVCRLMPDNMKERFSQICKEWLKMEGKGNGKK